MRTVTVFNTSWTTLGGGEKYACTLADTLAADPSTEVTLVAETPDITLERLRTYFHLELKAVRIDYLRRSDVGRRLETSDIAVIISNVWPFGNRARRNVYILQIPYTRITPLTIAAKLSGARFREGAKDVPRRSLLHDARNSDRVLVYSEFVRDVLLHNHAIDAAVLYPAIDDFGVKGKKKKVILSVGRFFRGLYNDKRYDILIGAFKEICRRCPDTPWQYHLAGSCGADDASRRYVESLRESAQGFPVYFHLNAPYAELRRHYNEATLFWHAAGFGVDEQRHPERAEHFGMSTVEAMSARCVPLAVRKGGQKEIVSHGESGYLWDTVDELVSTSMMLMQNTTALRRMREAARSRFRHFDRAHFSRRCLSIFHQLEAHDHGSK